jgi:hypothetical protein
VGGLPLSVEIPFEIVCWGAGLSLRLSKDLLRAFQWRPLWIRPVRLVYAYSGSTEVCGSQRPEPRAILPNTVTEGLPTIHSVERESMTARQKTRKRSAR